MVGNRPQFSMDESVHGSSLFGSINFAGTISQLRFHFPHNRTPDRSTVIIVIRNVNQYLTCGGSQIGDIVENQENIDFVRQTLQADPMMTAICNNMPNKPISPSLSNRSWIGSQYWILLWTLKSCSLKLLWRMVIFQEEKSRIWSIVDQPPDRFLCNQTKEIQMDFTKFAVTFEPKVQITQNKNLVKAIVNIHYIIVILTKHLCPFLRKKS